MEITNAKESGKELTLKALSERIEKLEERMNLRDKAVSRPDMKNYNEDPGPWTRK